MFLGEYKYKIDQKGRLAIPPEFRSEFKTGAVLRREADKCISIHALPQWEEMSQKLAPATLSRSNIRRRDRLIFGTAFKVNLDAQGRIVIPSILRQYADIADIAVILGVNNHLELWNNERWQAELESLDEGAWHIIESTGEQR